MVTLREEPGSIPSVLRAVFGVMIFTPQAVNPSVWFTATWKSGELRSVILYRVKSIRMAQRNQRRNALLLVGDLGLVRQVPPGHILAQQLGSAPSIDGASPMIPLSTAPFPTIRGLHPWPFSATMPQLPGDRS